MAQDEGAGTTPAPIYTDTDLVNLVRERYTATMAAAVEEALEAGGHFADFVRRSLTRELALEGEPEAGL